jgi:DNA-directed RNA polymerase specialized sigma subunit
VPEYLKPSELLKEVISCKQAGKLSNRLLEMFELIAKNSNKRLKYRDPMDKEDCISQAMEDLIKYWDRFDPDLSKNAFAYYSQIAKNGFAKAWNKMHPKEAPRVSLSDLPYNF